MKAEQGRLVRLIRYMYMYSCPLDAHVIRKKKPKKKIQRKIFKPQLHDHSISLPTGSGFATPMRMGP